MNRQEVKNWGARVLGTGLAVLVGFEAAQIGNNGLKIEVPAFLQNTPVEPTPATLAAATQESPVPTVVGTEVSLTEEPSVTPSPELTQCNALGDGYGLHEKVELATGPGGFIHVEYFVNGQPEYETVLPSGRYAVNPSANLDGHVWEYGSNCSVDQVLEQVKGNIERRLQIRANNKGYVHYQELLDAGFLTAIEITGDRTVPTELP